LVPSGKATARLGAKCGRSWGACSARGATGLWIQQGSRQQAAQAQGRRGLSLPSRCAVAETDDFTPTFRVAERRKSRAE
jgi:hypothetical protein